MNSFSEITLKPVQGVQGVQGKSFYTLHSCNHLHSGPAAFLCRVCRVALYIRAYSAKNHYSIKISIFAYICTLHTLHTLHSLCYACPTAVHGVFTTLHTLHNQYFLKKMKKIVCGEDNLEEFTAEFKKQAPEFYSLAKELFAAGMIVGIRGATLEPIDNKPKAIEPIATETKKTTCQQCAQWRRDKAGNGTGIGQCLLNKRPTQLKWPNADSCHWFAGGAA